MKNFIKTHHKKRFGRCFELSGKYVFKTDQSKFLVHGAVYIITLPLAHAWVEDEGQNVYDLIENKVYTKDQYSKKFNAKKKMIYTYDDLVNRNAKYGHWGPWAEDMLIPFVELLLQGFENEEDLQVENSPSYLYWQEEARRINEDGPGQI